MISYIVELSETHITSDMCKKYGWKNNGYKMIECMESTGLNGIEVVEIESDKVIDEQILGNKFDILLTDAELVEFRYLCVHTVNGLNKMKLLMMKVPPFMSNKDARKIVDTWTRKIYDEEYLIFTYNFLNSAVNFHNLDDFYEVAKRITNGL